MTTDKEILRIALADHAFREAHALGMHILESKFDPNSHLFSGAIAGFVITYCRPFMSGSGLGPLPDEYKEFPDTVLKDAHDMVFEARNKMTAHADLIHVSGLHSKGIIKNHPGAVQIELTPQGAVFETTATYFNSQNLPLAMKLLDFQLSRTHDRMASIGAELLLRNRKLGTYSICVK